jgi:hypothetical protein
MQNIAANEMTPVKTAHQIVILSPEILADSPAAKNDHSEMI